jgi:farnesyl-diphosphate farnesyltransferase
MGMEREIGSLEPGKRADLIMLDYQALGLQPADLLRPESESKLRPYYETLLNLAASHLRAGWGYTNALPRSSMRMRLVCAWPILIGVRTLARLRRQNVLEAGQRIKISRAEVRGLVLRSILSHPWQGAWNRLYDRAASG